MNSVIQWSRPESFTYLTDDVTDVWRFLNTDSFTLQSRIRKVLALYISGNPNNITIDKTDLGKPFSSQLVKEGFFYNYSHSNQVVLLAVSRTQEIGVDVEYVYQTLDLDALLKSSLTESEIQTIDKFPSKRLAVLTYWTRKEAILKAIGIGHSIALTDLNISISSDNETFDHYSGGWCLNTFVPVYGYIASVAVKKNKSLNLRFYSGVA